MRGSEVKIAMCAWEGEKEDKSQERQAGRGDIFPAVPVELSSPQAARCSREATGQIFLILLN